MTKGRRIGSDSEKLKYRIVGYHKKYDMIFLKSGGSFFFQKPGMRIKKYITEEDGSPNGFVQGSPSTELMDKFPVSTRKYLQPIINPTDNDDEKHWS